LTDRDVVIRDKWLIVTGSLISLAFVLVFVVASFKHFHLNGLVGAFAGGWIAAVLNPSRLNFHEGFVASLVIFAAISLVALVLFIVSPTHSTLQIVIVSAGGFCCGANIRLAARELRRKLMSPVSNEDIKRD
jgi:hypothetical protein